MNFLNKARQKAEELARDIQAQVSAQGIGQPQHIAHQQSPHQYQQGTPQYQQHFSSPPPQWNQQEQSYLTTNHSGQSIYPQQHSPAQVPNQSSLPTPNLYGGSISSSNQAQYSPTQVFNQFSPPPQAHGGHIGPPQILHQSPSAHPANQFSPLLPHSYGAQTHSPLSQEHHAILLSEQVPAEAPQAATGGLPVNDGMRKCLAKELVLLSKTRCYSLVPSVGVSGELFGICSNCFQLNVVPTSLASFFVEYQNVKQDAKFMCDFSLPRVRSTFYRECIPQNSIQALVDFAYLTETLASCDGSIVSGPGHFWTTKNEAIPELAICETHFELLLRVTEFEGHFEKVTFSDSREWSCDLALPFFNRTLLTELRQPDPVFEDTVSEFNTRFKMQPCSGEGKSITTWENDAQQSLVFTATDGKTGNICFACYCDCLSGTCLSEAFIPAALSSEQKKILACDLASKFSKSAMAVAIKYQDDEIWRSSIGVQGKVGNCLARGGVTEIPTLQEKLEERGSIVQWYHVNGHPTIEICPSCYWTVVKLYRADHMFSPITRPLRVDMTRMCFLAPSNVPFDVPIDDPELFENSTAWRGRRLRITIDYGYETGDFSRLLSESESISKEPPPCGGNARGFKRPTGRRWFGRLSQNIASSDDCTIVLCEECHSRTVKGTSLEAHFSLDLTEAAWENEGLTGFECQPYSNRARQELRSAAQCGDLASFARYWNRREERRKKRDQWPAILGQQNQKMAIQNQQQNTNMMMKMSAMSNALQMQSGAGVVEAAMSDPGVRYGNSSVGYDHYTKAGAEAAQAWQNASNMPGGTATGSMGVIAETQRLLIMAQQAETEFQAYE